MDKEKKKDHNPTAPHELVGKESNIITGTRSRSVVEIQVRDSETSIEEITPTRTPIIVRSSTEIQSTTPTLSPTHQRLRQKVALYEKVWSSGSGMKRNSEDSSDSPTFEGKLLAEGDDDSVFGIDVSAFEKRLKEERDERGVESPTFANVRLRSTPRPLPRTSFGSDKTPTSPFNVTLRHTSRTNPHEEGVDYLLETPDEFITYEKKTLRTTQETTSSDGVKTIVTTTTDRNAAAPTHSHHIHDTIIRQQRYPGGSDRERASSEEHEFYTRTSSRCSSTPPRTIDLTAGGQQILIKFDGSSTDETDDIRQLTTEGKGHNVMETSESIITVGNRAGYHGQLQKQPSSYKSKTKTTTRIISSSSYSTPLIETKTKTSLCEGGDLDGDVNQPIGASGSGISITSSSIHISGDKNPIERSCFETKVGSAVSEHLPIATKISDYSETRSAIEDRHRIASGSCSSGNQVEYREYQSTMAAMNFARSNSQYDSHIKEKREEQERVQKKTFTNWINSYLSKRIPPLRVDDLINDLRDGTKLIALLEVLSGERLPVEKGRVLRRPHFLSNANTALQFLASKRIKLVNINPADLVDGRPPVVLGLIWTIILYFQIEENSRALEYLGHGMSGSVSSLDSVGKTVSDTKAEKWKQGARKTLLNWVTNALPKDIGVEVRDFGASWRDGVAFLALIDAIKANLINLAELKKATNRQRLQTAFDVAETKLGIAKLLDAEDVDVPKPDEKSIMTYVAQFLHKYPEPKGAGQGSSDIQLEADELRHWLMQKTQEYQPMVLQNSFPRDFGEYLIARSEIDAHYSIYHRIQNLVETQSGFLQVSKQSWEEIHRLWQLVQYQIMYWLWLLDSELPGDLGTVGKWLAEAEKLLLDNEIPSVMNEETASVISRKLEEHKLFFAQLPKIEALFENAKRSPYAQNVPLEQLRNIEIRLQEIGPKSTERRIKLKFLEHKCCLIAFLNLVENKMKGWTGKYGSEDKVQQQLEQYKNFVSRNKIFQEFQKAFIDMQQVVDEYKRDGNVTRKETSNIDQFMFETEERWKRVSMELKCCQNSLEEVVNCWKTWNSLSPVCEDWLNKAERKIGETEDDRLEFFQDIGVWKEKFQSLSSSVTYLIASCQDPIASDLRNKHIMLSERFERLFANTKQYMHAGDIIRSRQEYKSGIEKLSSWLRDAENKLKQKHSLGNIEQIKSYADDLQRLASEIDDNEELFKTISRNFQGLIQDLSREEVDKTMKILKQEKESLVRIRARIPSKLHLIHQLLLQQESLEAGQKEISQWLNEAENLLSKNTLVGGRESVYEELNKIKSFFSRTVYYRSMLESKNKVFQNLLKSISEDDAIDTTNARQEMQHLNDRFNYVIQNANQLEKKLNDTVHCWNNFKDSEHVVSEWLSQAEMALSEKHIESKTSIESQKYFFEHVNEAWMNNLVQSAQDLSRNLPESEQIPVLDAVEKLQARWQDVLSQAPLHLLKLEFRLDENVFHQYIKEIEKEIHLEQQALNRNEDVESILNRNRHFFSTQGAVPRIERCLDTMKRLSQAYSNQMPNDSTLKSSYNTAEQQWKDVANRVDDLVQTLQQIPAQWENYHRKFNEMVIWMNSVDRSLKNIVNEVNSMEEFEKEKVVFQKICQEADMKREDMKWLVKTLDSLLSYATENEANIEQKKLEDLIARYKNLIPTIEVTMVKTEVFSKCFTYRREVHEVVCLLTKVKEQTANASAPDSLEKVNKMIQEQQYAISQLDHQRPHIMSMLQRGRDLSKDVHAPSFVVNEVKNLETGWNEAYTETVDKLQTLKGTQNVWSEFVDQKNDIFSLLQTAETELRALTPLQTDPKNVSQDLKAKRDLNVSLQQASHQLIPKLHALRGQLAPLAAIEKRPVLEKEVAEVEKMFFNTMEHVKDRVGYLEDYSAKWNNYKLRLTELQEWANRVAPKVIEALQSEDLTPEERVSKVNSLKGILSEKMKQLDILAADASELAPKEGNVSEAKRLKGEIVKLQEVFSAINRNVSHQAQAVQEDLVNWQRYQAGIQQIKPLIEDSEIKKVLSLLKIE